MPKLDLSRRQWEVLLAYLLMSEMPSDPNVARILARIIEKLERGS